MFAFLWGQLRGEFQIGTWLAKNTTWSYNFNSGSRNDIKRLIYHNHSMEVYTFLAHTRI